MRTLLLFGTLVTAVFVPWSSISPTWLADGSDSASTAADLMNHAPSSVAALSGTIVPLADDPPNDSSVVSGVASQRSKTSAADRIGDGPAVANPGSFGSRDLPPGVHCENGVCTIPPSMLAASAEQSPSGLTSRPLEGEFDWQEARERLRAAGVTRHRLETGLERGQIRLSCSLPTDDPDGTVKEFEAVAARETDVVIQVLEQIEAWKQAER